MVTSGAPTMGVFMQVVSLHRTYLREGARREQLIDESELVIVGLSLEYRLTAFWLL